MWQDLKKWVREHKLPSIFIILTLVVIVFFGIYAGLAWLTVEVFDIHPRWALRDRAQTIGVTYHHTAASDVSIEQHHNFHQDARGWNMVGYAYQVREDGTIEQGRPHEKTGAHAGAEGNSLTIGVALSGNMMHEPPTNEQYDSAAELHYWLEGQYQKKLTIYGHDDWMNTSCPGVLTNLDEIEWRVKEWRTGVRTPDNPQGIIEQDEKEESIRKQIEIEILEGRVRGKTTSGYLVIEEGRVYVPVRWVSEELGHNVEWHEDERLWEVN